MQEESRNSLLHIRCQQLSGTYGPHSTLNFITPPLAYDDKVEGIQGDSGGFLDMIISTIAREKETYEHVSNAEWLRR